MTVNPVQSLRRLAGDPVKASTRESWGFWLYAGQLVSIAALGASNTLLALGVLITPWARARTWIERGRPLLLALGFYLIGLIGSILASYSPATSVRSASDIFNFLAPVLALFVLRRERQIRFVLQALVWLSIVISIHVLVQYYFLGFNHVDQRPVGPFSHYMTLAGFLVFVDCLLLAWVAYGRGWRRWWCWAALVVNQLALLASLTRNAWIAFTVMAVVLMALRAPKLLLATVPAALVIIVLMPGSTVARVTSIADVHNASNYDRLCMTYAGVHMIRDRPLLGQGPRMVRQRYPLYRHPTAHRDWVPHLHNSFLSLAAERGLVSLTALIALLVIPARESIGILRDPERRARAPVDLHVAVLLVIFATATTGMFEDYWRDTEIQRLVFFALAMPFCLRPPTDDRP